MARHPVLFPLITELDLSSLLIHAIQHTNMKLPTRSFLPLLALTGSSFLGLKENAQALTIVINREASFTNDDAYDAFVRAADTWEGFFTDDITVNIAADFSSFGAARSTVLGSTNSLTAFASYDAIVTQLQNNADADDSIIPFLPNSAQFTAATSAGDSISTNVQANKANLKAMGFTGVDTFFGTTNDGNISFNSDFTFDLDNTDGVSSGAFDFETIALHEIAHLLGFTSVVDAFDQTDAELAPYVFDLFRLGSNDPSLTGAAFTTAERQLTPGEASYFSDGTTQISLATGVTEGDGNQASHFKDNQGLGVLDPTLAPGETVEITENDLIVLDAIGYDRVTPVVAAVPEPSSAVLLAIAGLVACGRRRRH